MLSLAHTQLRFDTFVAGIAVISTVLLVAALTFVPGIAAVGIPVYATTNNTTNAITTSTNNASAPLAAPVVAELKIFEDGSGFILYENGTERHFVHNITGPKFLYENDTIYHSSNLAEVF